MADTNHEIKVLPTGISDWDDIRYYDMFFVDKTEKLKSLVKIKRKIFLSRPRRMGKSILCSMLAELFKKGVTDDFRDTAIYHSWPEQHTYPVIKISFISVTGHDVASFEKSLINELAAAYRQAGFPEVMQFKSESESLDDFLKRLYDISNENRLVLLIDEWDHPLSSRLGSEEKFNDILSVLKQFYSWVRRLNHLRFVLVTGIMRYRSASLFTGQDIRDISMDPAYASLIGYTHEELITNYAPYIKEAAKRRGESEEELIAQLKDYYDGFCFDANAQVKLYSPWDINQFFDSIAPDAEPGQTPEFKPFWMDSSNAADALKEFLSKRQIDFNELCSLKYHDIELDSDELTTPVDFAQVKILPLLAESGYLTIKGIVSQTAESVRYRCGLSNAAVLQRFDYVLKTHIQAKTRLKPAQVSAVKTVLGKALEQGDINQVCKSLNELLCGLPYDIYLNANEALYRTLIANWIRDVATNVREETFNYKGRSDIELVKGNNAYVLELKLIHNITENDAKRSYQSKYRLIKAAAQQISNNGYAVNPHTDGLPVTAVVLVISNKRRCIAAWHKFNAHSASCGRLSTVNLFNKYNAAQAQINSANQTANSVV